MFDCLQPLFAFVVGIILIILGITPVHAPALTTGGVTKPKKSIKLLTATDYAKPVAVAPYSDRWATGDLVEGYPVCPFVDKTGPLPRDVVYTGIKNLSFDLPPRHWGQRKLLLTEIDFLNRCPKDKSIMVYAGAADGRHIPILVDMYPHVEFHLYDPREFYRGLDGYRNIRLNPYYGGATEERKSQYGWFTDEVAEWYATREGRWCNVQQEDGMYKPGTCRVLHFVSDIRTAPTEEGVEHDQRRQETWIRTMRPHRSMVKFRVPYPHVDAPREYRYLAGSVRLQCWAPIRSAETRLIIDAPAGKAKFPDGTWDAVVQERNCAWYNWVMRTHDFSARKLRDFGIPVDGTVREFWSGKRPLVPADLALGFDFVYELQILTDYLNTHGSGCTKESLRELVEKINQTLINPGARFQNYLKK
jgi:hypothetical protein